MPKLILVRHGQSLWNLEDRFTGWVDVPLTEKGRNEAIAAGEKLKDISIDVAYTSGLQRAQLTLELIQQGMGREIPVIRDPALNERHYGDLQGLNKTRTAAKFGDEQVKIWRRSFDIPPPNGESLKDTAERTLPFFRACILGDIAQGKDVLVVAHGNSNRSIVMDIEDLTPEQILEVNLATGVPIVYEMDTEGKLLGKTVLE